MSERVRRLAESEAFQLAPVAYSILDPDGRQLASNPAFQSVFRSDRPGQRAEEMTHESDRELTASYLADLISGKRDRVVVDKRYIRGDDTTFWGRLTATAVRDDDGNPEFLIGMIDDVTSQHDALSAEQAASEAKSSFVARVSHDLRTPLHAIRGLAELLTLAEVDPTTRGFAEAIRTEADTLRALVDDLLDLSRLEAGRVELNPVVFPLGASVRGAVDLVRSRAEAKGLELRETIDSAVDRNVWGDGERLRQVLVNLLDNAVKFTDSGSVTIGVRRGERDDVIIAVRDTGVGVDSEVMARIFEPFGRANEDRTGTGLGLTICRDLVQRMGGSLDLESTVGQGTLFTIRVPLPRALGHEVSTPSPPKEPSLDSRPPFVLVVEDSPINQLLAAGQLDQLGCRHEIAATGMEALAAFSRKTFDLVLMDWHLPDMDGLETTQWLRDIETQADLGRIPVVAVTARTMTGDRQRCLDAGMDDFLPKPVAMGDLALTLQKWLPAGIAGRMAIDPATPSEPVADTDAIQRLLDDLGDRALVATLVTTFLDELPGRLSTIIEANAGADTDAMRRAAHTLKSTSAIVGASDLASIAADIESRARAAETPLDEAVAELKAAAARVTTDFTETLTTLEQP